jgi:hypothetical protein
LSAERRVATVLLLGAVAVPALARDARGQRLSPTAPATYSPEAAWRGAAAGDDGGAALAPAAPLVSPRALPPAPGRRGGHEGWAPVASALLPGAGQAMLRQGRSVPYLALEAYAWLRYATDTHEARRQRSAYRDLARNVARAAFSSSPPVGTWDYYERLEHYVESGAFDAAPNADGVQPETDTLTYNGSVWLLARRTYWADPESPPDSASRAYASAMGFYRQRAVTGPYRWSWRGAQLEQDLFRQRIARSNDAYRRAAQDLAVVIANHVLSTVDAYVSIRLRGGRAGVEGGSAGGSDDGYGVSVSLPLPGRAAPHR